MAERERTHYFGDGCEPGHELAFRPVAEANALCGLDLRNQEERRRGGSAASDTCRASATTMVRVGSAWQYRCEPHRGIAFVTMGEVTEYVQGNPEARRLLSDLGEDVSFR